MSQDSFHNPFEGASRMWKGVAIYEAFKSFHTPNGLKLTSSRQERLEGENERGAFHFYTIVVADEDIACVTKWAQQMLRPGWYMHLVKCNHMRVIFKDTYFDIQEDDLDSIERVKSYGVNNGIHRDQLAIEKLFDDPFS